MFLTTGQGVTRLRAIAHVRNKPASQPVREDPPVKSRYGCIKTFLDFLPYGHFIGRHATAGRYRYRRDATHVRYLDERMAFAGQSCAEPGRQYARCVLAGCELRSKRHAVPYAADAPDALVCIDAGFHESSGVDVAFRRLEDAHRGDPSGPSSATAD